MIHRYVFLILAMGLGLPAFAAKPLRASLIVTVSLSKHSMTIQKNTRKSRSVLTAWIIPVAPGTIAPGTYKFERMKDRFKTEGGNIYIENILRTDGNFNIRSSRMFKTWKENGNPANHAIILDAETGSLLFSTINNYGISHAVLRVIP